MTELIPSVGAGLSDRTSFQRVRDAAHRLNLPIQAERATSMMVGCPAHAEQTPSLHVTWENGHRGGYTLLWCFGCQAPAADLAEALGLGLADLFDEPMPAKDLTGRLSKSPERRRAGSRRGRLGRLPAPIAQAAPVPDVDHVWAEVERYPYTDLQGTLVQEVVREECVAEGSRHKRFRQVFFNSRGEAIKTKPQGFFPFLYRAPEVRDAVAAGETVWLVEGEKDVHTAERAGLTATTNAQGAGSFPEELVDCLEGADLVVVLDRDTAGWARGVDLHAKLSSKVRRLRLVLPAVEDPKADLTDHVDAGHSVEDLVQVTIEEVATWHALSAVEAKAQSLRKAVDEARAHQQVAVGDDADSHLQHARRWALETQVRQEALRELVDQVYGHGLRVGSAWVGQALAAADRILNDATIAARRCHHDLGVALPASLREQGAPATTAAPPRDETVAPPAPARTAGGTGFSSPDRGAGARAPVFRELGGQIVQWEPTRGRSRNEDDEEEDGSFKVVLSTVVRVVAREYLEVEKSEDAANEVELMGRASSGRSKAATPAQLIAVRLEYPDPVTGERMEIRVMADQWRDHSWLESLPGPVDYDHKRAGLDTVQRAILAISTDVVDEVLHRATGWRLDEDGTARFIHRRGAITAEGHQDLDVALSGALERFDLPDPTTDAARLREAFLKHSAGMLQRLPDRVSAPLLGHAYRAVLGHNPWVLALVGPPGSYKTSVAAKVMHHFGERWEHSKPASSMSGNGDTFNTLRFKLHNAKDLLYWADDFAPTKSWLEAQKAIEETARLIHNQEERGRTARDGLSTTAGTPPRASALFTSEVMPRPGSGAERMLVVPLAREDVDTQLLFPLDEAPSRHGRALVMASFISWLARDLRARRTHYTSVAGEYADQLTDAGETVRQAAAIAQTWTGWVAMTDFMVDVDAISDRERTVLLHRVDTALRQAGQAAVDPDMPRSTGARVLELLAYALRQGIAYVDDVRTGDCPPWPLAARLGWRRQVLEQDAHGTALRSRYERQGISLGYALHDPDARERGRLLMCESTQIEAVLKAASATQAEKLEIDRNTAMRALAEVGALVRDTSEARTRFTIKCRLHVEGRTARMVAIRLDDLLGPESFDDGGDAGAAEPGPSGPHQDPGAGGRGPVEPIVPGLFDDLDDPQQLDGGTEPGQPEQVTPDHGDIAPDQPALNEEDPVVPFDPWYDADGLAGVAQIGEDSAPCVVCAKACVVTILGQRVHGPCWERTTAAEREGRAAAQPTPLPQAPQVVRASVAEPVSAAGPFIAAREATGLRAAAAVVDVDTVWCSNGERLALQGPVRHVGDLVDLARRLSLGTQITSHRNAAGQVWVTDALAQQLGFDVAAIAEGSAADQDGLARQLTLDAPAVQDAVAAGYHFGGKGGLGRWTRVRKGEDRGVWIVLLAAMPRDDVSVPLLAGDPDHATLARRIGRLAEALGHPYQLSGATTGLDLMMALRGRPEERELYFSPREPIPPAQISNVEADISWSRRPTEEELKHEWVHAYDRSGSYLAGVAGLDLGVGDPVHHPDGRPFEKVPGYWRIEVPENGDWRMPNPLDPRGITAGRTRWVTTPGLEFAIEQGYDPEVLEAWVWPAKARILDPWYERIRDARTALDVDDPDCQAARDQLKAIYAPTIGMLGSQIHMAGRAAYAPDRRHFIVAKARTNILRRVATIGRDTGRWPVAIIADTVLYTSDVADPVQAWPGGQRWFGRNLGQYKAEGSAPLGEHLEFLTGGPYKGKAAIAGDDAGSE